MKLELLLISLILKSICDSKSDNWLFRFSSKGSTSRDSAIAFE